MHVLRVFRPNVITQNRKRARTHTGHARFQLCCCESILHLTRTASALMRNQKCKCNFFHTAFKRRSIDSRFWRVFIKQNKHFSQYFSENKYFICIGTFFHKYQCISLTQYSPLHVCKLLHQTQPLSHPGRDTHRNAIIIQLTESHATTIW